MIGKTRMYLRTFCLLGGLLVTIGSINPLSAQWEVGANVSLAIPQDEFDEVTDTGTGLALKGMYRVRTFPSVSLRSDLTFVTYNFGRYSGYYSGYPYTAETRTQAIRLTLGPQLSLRHRRVQVYISPMYGFYYYYTHDDMFDIYGRWLTRSRNSTAEFGWNISGGVTIDILHLPKRSFDLALDIGGSWHSVRQGFETDLEVDEGTVTVKRDVKELCIHAGVVFLFR